MTRPFRFLGVINSTSTGTSQSPAYDSDFVIILAALLCAIICVLGLIAVARCAWLHRISVADSTPSMPLSNKGLKKKVLRSLPTLTFTAVESSECSDCAICLTQFSLGDEIRVLPHCRHRFHVLCIDTWFGSHSSCPSCRHILGIARCDKCGGLTTNKSSIDGPDNEMRVKEREDGHAHTNTNKFLP